MKTNYIFLHNIHPGPFDPYTNMLNIMGNLLFWESKLINPNPLKQKKAKFKRFFRTKSPLTQKKLFQTPFFFKILKAVCLGFVHVPDRGPIPFQIIVQKFVQRCLAKPLRDWFLFFLSLPNGEMHFPS